MDDEQYDETVTVLTKRVEKGISLLDERWPVWWTESEGVDIDVLDISAGHHCMTAQAAQRLGIGGGVWLDGLRHFELTDGQYGSYVGHGFNVGDSEFPSTEFDILNDLWRSAIIKRREAATAE